MDENERQALIRDLRVLFAELRRLGYLDGYHPGEARERPVTPVRAHGSGTQCPPRADPADPGSRPPE